MLAGLISDLVSGGIATAVGGVLVVSLSALVVGIFGALELSRRRALGMAWERGMEVAQLVRRIESEKANVLLIGESGVGKTTVVAEAARRRGNVADRLVPHVRDPSEFEAMQAVYPFGASILALYRSQASNELTSRRLTDSSR